MNGPMPYPHRAALTRRRILLATGGVAAVAAAAAAPARFARAAATPAEAEMARILAGRTPKEGAGLRLDVPSIAENGLVVPLAVEADSPMTEADFVTAIHVIAEGNPNPLVATFRFTPLSGKAAASMRMRLAQTQDVVAVAETSGGELRIARQEVKVTIGGCGG